MRVTPEPSGFGASITGVDSGRQCSATHKRLTSRVSNDDQPT